MRQKDKGSGFDFRAPGTELGELAKQLKKHNQSKEAMLKALKPVSRIFEECPQDVSALAGSAEALAQGLLQHSKHPDKDIKLYVAECMAKLLRIYAPETPYPDEELHDVFELLIWAMSRLDKPSGATFNLSLTVLTLMEQVKFHLLLLDIPSGNLIPKLLDSLLRCARDSNVDTVEGAVLEILSSLFIEAGPELQVVATPELLDLCLLALAGRGAADGQTSRLAGKLIKQCEDILRPCLQQRLITLLLHGCKQQGTKKRPADEEGCEDIEDDDAPAAAAAGGSVLKAADVHSAIVKLYAYAPQILLPVLPHVRGQLEAEAEARRLMAIDLMVQLYCAADSDVAEQDPVLLDAFMRRFLDLKADVRGHMLGQLCTMAVAGVSFRPQLLEAAAGRLLDTTESVRAAACKALCAASCSDLASVPLSALEEVGRRVRDSKAAVREAALAGLVDLFRAWCTQVAKGGFSDSIDHLAVWIPSRICWLALCTSAVAHSMACVLAKLPGGLLPPGLKEAAAADIWAMVYDRGHPLEQEALLANIAARSKAQEALAEYASFQLAARRSSSSSDAVEREALQRRSARFLSAVVMGCHWGGTMQQSRALELVPKLAEVKDGRVFERLATLGDPVSRPSEIREARKDLLERLGSKSPLAEMVGTLLNAAQPLLLQPLHLEALLEAGLAQRRPAAAAALGRAGGEGGKELGAAAAGLVAELGRRAPALLAPLVPRLAGLVASCPPHMQGRAAATAGAFGMDDSPDQEPQQQAAGLSDESLSLAVQLLGRAAAHYMTSRGASQQPLPLQDVESALRWVCRSGPLRAARWGPAALQALLAAAGKDKQPAPGAGKEHGGRDTASPAGGAQQVLRDVARSAARALVPSAATAPTTPAAIHALCGVGRVCPDAFSAHADSLTNYVTGIYLEAVLEDCPDSEQSSPGEQHPLAPGLGHRPPAPGCAACPLPSRGVALKGLALKALARALAPDSAAPLSPPLALEVKQAAKMYEQVLDSLLDLDADLSHLGAANDVERGHLRLVAAKALLRLSWHHRLSPRVWANMGLSMQDPLPHVRAVFRAKVWQHVQKLNRKAGMQARLSLAALEASQCASLLALAGIDPLRPNVEYASRSLREFVATRRVLALQCARQCEDAQNHTSQQPELLLAFLIYLLGHHPDMPSLDPDSPSPPDVSALQSFALILQLALEALLVAPGQYGQKGGTKQGLGTKPGPDPPGSSLALVLKLLTSIKSMEDCDEGSPAMDKIRALCDMAEALARDTVRHAGGSPDAVTARDYPGPLMLPGTLFRKAQAGCSQPAGGRLLPDGFSPALDLDLWGCGSKKPEPPGLVAQELGEGTGDGLGSPEAARPQRRSHKAGAGKGGARKGKASASDAGGGGGGAKGKAGAKVQQQVKAKRRSFEDDDSGSSSGGDGEEEEDGNEEGEGAEAAPKAKAPVKDVGGGRERGAGKENVRQGQKQQVQDTKQEALELQEQKRQKQAAAAASEQRGSEGDVGDLQHTKRAKTQQQQQQQQQQQGTAMREAAAGGNAKKAKGQGSKPEAEKKQVQAVASRRQPSRAKRATIMKECDSSGDEAMA